MIVGLVAMYMPKENEIRNIEKYIFDLDFCFLLDDSAVDNSGIVKGLVENGNEKVEYHCNSHNLGLCASVNNGFKMAIAKGADWILVMNPDGSFQNNAIAIYKNYIKNNDVSKTAIIAPRLTLIEEKNRLEWVVINDELLNNEKFAGNYNIPHIIRQIKIYLKNGTSIDKY